MERHKGRETVREKKKKKRESYFPLFGLSNFFFPVNVLSTMTNFMTATSVRQSALTTGISYTKEEVG